ncbi:tail assembly chaperone protein [Serratia phage Muldoon]|uniref:Tail assembly chaperone protein n=1 Tax=Serratia phage Muldoon TaxID=2601678 RepID=A0A5P8PJ65_9CAUD|nr:tail fiber chaperone [Serratia phage Muldoon]QFR56100.1 tail assembly chaperone protein [Serratia phage Muldoon]
MTEQQMQEQIASLKIRLFDMGEQYAALEAQAGQFQQALVQIAGLLGVTGESVQLQDVIEAVRVYAPVQETADEQELLVEAPEAE